MSERDALQFYGGTAGALAPFALFLAGVGWLGLAGAPDERGFWPVLLAALALGLLLARDRNRYAEAVIDGMSRPIVMLMVMAWLLAGVLGTLMGAGGLIDALLWIAGGLGLGGTGFVLASFVVCAVVSTATGTSLGTILLCAPLLYPAGGLLGAEPAVLVGAIIGGATFGDNVSPVSDTTIASAMTQGADLGGVVRSRLKYALAAAALALVAYGVAAAATTAAGSAGGVALPGSPRGLPMLLAPAVALALLLARRHLVEGLMWGSVTAVVIGLTLGLLAPAQLMSIDADAFIARGLILDGMERGIGVSVFTLLLMGLVGGIEATGVTQRVIDGARRRIHSPRGAEAWIFAAVSAVVVLTTHSAVAILTVGRFASETGAALGIGRYRRANILDITVCTYPFLLPFFIPTILIASTTAAGLDVGLPRVSALQAGLHNFHSWALLAVVLAAIATGWGRNDAVDTTARG
ncbi:MAG: Na+/H+ antiporter NhaC family protein [Acidobacteriota bacterium]|jgi:Na+/H+ antiporter NhaC